MNQHILRIVQMDIYIRDERVLAFIRERISSGQSQITHETIAERFHCSRQTALAIVRRLERNEFITIDKSAKRGGYTYCLQESHARDGDRT